MEQDIAWIEQPFAAAGNETWLKSRYQQLSEADADDPANQGLRQDLGLASLLSSERGRYFELMLAGKLRLQSAAQLNIGDNLAVEIELAGDPEPVKTLAVVVGQIPQKMGAMHVSALRFIAVSQQRPTAPEARA